MKKHILQENYERMFGSIKEDWWDDMDASAQAQYIKDHPGSKRAQSAKDTDGDEDDYDMGVVPGSRELDDTPEDDSEKGSSLTSAPGRVPDEDEPEEEPSGEPEGGGELGKDEYGNITGTAEQWKSGEHDEPAAEFAKDSDGEYNMDHVTRQMDSAQRDDSIYRRRLEDGEISEEEYEKAHDEAAADMEQAIAAKRHIEKQQGGEKKPIPAKDLANDPNADTGPDSRGTAWSGDYSGAEDSAEWEEQYRETEEWADEYPEDAEKLAQIKWFGEKQGWGDGGELSSSARTGNELNQETLTIDGKQYRRINESVKQKPKPKYEFAEFYKRFKR